MPAGAGSPSPPPPLAASDQSVGEARRAADASAARAEGQGSGSGPERPKLRRRAMSYSRAPARRAVSPRRAAAQPADPTGGDEAKKEGGDGAAAKPAAPTTVHTAGEGPRYGRALSFGRRPRRKAAASPASGVGGSSAGRVSAPGSLQRLREIEALLEGVGGGDARSWLAKAEGVMSTKVAEPSRELDARVFVRVGNPRLGSVGFYRPKKMYCNEDHLNLQDIGEGTILHCRPSDPLRFELHLVFQSSKGSNVEVHLRCLRKLHYDHLLNRPRPPPEVHTASPPSAPPRQLSTSHPPMPLARAGTRTANAVAELDTVHTGAVSLNT